MFPCCKTVVKQDISHLVLVRHPMHGFTFYLQVCRVEQSWTAAHEPPPLRFFASLRNHAHLRSLTVMLLLALGRRVTGSLLSGHLHLPPAPSAKLGFVTLRSTPNSSLHVTRKPEDVPRASGPCLQFLLHHLSVLLPFESARHNRVRQVSATLAWLPIIVIILSLLFNVSFARLHR